MRFFQLNNHSIAALTLSVAAAFAPCHVSAQEGPAASKSAIPAGPPAVAPPKVQALVGSWSITKSGRGLVAPPAGFISYTPAYEAKRAEIERKFKAHEILPGRNAKCIPDGLPDMMQFGFRLEANADYMTMIGGNGPTIRTIWLNKKQHTEDRLLFPTYGGEGIAHWEGDTLIVDTIGLNSGNEITYGLPLNDEHIHIVERFRLRSPNEVEVVTTVESPVALTKPWVYTSIFGRRAFNGEIPYCDRPVDGDSLDLTPPTGGYVPPGADE